METTNKKKIRNIVTMLYLVVFMILSMSVSFSTLELKNIQFDPAIIVAGDEVDVVIEYQQVMTNLQDERVSNPDYSFTVELVADDDVTLEHISILDSIGDDMQGTVYNNQVYNKVFRIKVDLDAPVGSYQFKLNGIWYKNGVELEATQSSRFEMQVKKEGIIIEPSTLLSNPAQIRSGDDYAELVTSIFNVGEKDAKSVEVTLDLPQGISSSYTNGNRIFLPRINAGDSQEVNFFIDVDEVVKSGTYPITMNFNYLDLDNNEYNKTKELDLAIKPRPYLVIESYEGSGLSGSDGELKVLVKNIGEQSAESVDVRIIKESSQPFEFDVRSNFVGELEPNETGVAIFNFNILSQAELKNHSFKLQVRSLGDSDYGDDNVYMYDRRAEYEVNGVAPNYYIYIGGVLFVLFILYLIVKPKAKSKEVKHSRKGTLRVRKNN